MNDDILFKKNGYVFIEIKSHIPESKKDDERNNLMNVIKKMFIK